MKSPSNYKILYPGETALVKLDHKDKYKLLLLLLLLLLLKLLLLLLLLFWNFHIIPLGLPVGEG